MKKRTPPERNKTLKKPLKAKPGNKPPKASVKNKKGNRAVKKKNKYRFLFDQALDAIMITDFKGNFKDVNPGLCKMFGYSRNELLKMNIAALIDSDELKIQP